MSEYESKASVQNITAFILIELWYFKMMKVSVKCYIIERHGTQFTMLFCLTEPLLYTNLRTVPLLEGTKQNNY